MNVSTWLRDRGPHAPRSCHRVGLRASSVTGPVVTERSRMRLACRPVGLVERDGDGRFVSARERVRSRDENESYEEFARALQTEYEDDCGVTFGKVPLTALAKLTRVVDAVSYTHLTLP